MKSGQLQKMWSQENKKGKLKSHRCLKNVNERDFSLGEQAESNQNHQQ